MYYNIICDGVSIYDNAVPGKMLLDPTLKREISSAAVLTYGLPRQSVYYDVIKPYASTLTVTEDGHLIFVGRPLPPSLDMDGTRRYRVEGAYAWLNDVIVDPAAIPDPEEAKDTSTYITNIIDYYNTKVGASRQLDITVLPVAGTNLKVREWQYETCADAISRELDEVGLVALVRYTAPASVGLRVCDYRDYINNQPPLTQVVRWGENIRSISVEGLPFVTALRAEGDDGASVYVESSNLVNRYGYICGKKSWPISNVNILRQRAITYLSQEQPVGASHVEVSAVDLHLKDATIAPLDLARPAQIDAVSHGVPAGTILPISAITYRLDKPSKDIMIGWPDQTIETLTGQLR